MNEVVFPITSKTMGPEVTDLHDALEVLLERAELVRDNEQSRRALATQLERERKARKFDKTTTELVRAFQQERGIRARRPGDVDEETAKAINSMLVGWGLIKKGLGNQPFVIGGTVRHADEQPYAGGKVRAYQETEAGSIRLGTDTVDDEGAFAITYQPLPGIRPIRLRVSVSSRAGRVVAGSDVIDPAGPLERIDVVVPLGEDGIAYIVEGVVSSPDRVGLGDLRVVVFDVDASGERTELAQTTTDERGMYRVAFTAEALREASKMHPDLQVRVFAGDSELGASLVRINAGQLERIDVALPPAVEIKNEYDTLLAVVAPLHAGNLRNLRETGDRHDVTYLAEKSGWDARLIAMAALADRYSQPPEDNPDGPTLAAPLYYALFRNGLPTEAESLFGTDPSAVLHAWEQAIEDAIVSPALAPDLSQAQATYLQLRAEHSLVTPPLEGASTLQELLQPVLDDEAQRQFSQLRAEYGKDVPTFWKQTEEAFGAETAQRLRLDGQLAYLTRNNAPLIASLHERETENPPSSLRDLVQQGFYRAEAWAEIDPNPEGLQRSLAQGDGADVSYHEQLAARIRLGFPTGVIAAMVANDELPISSSDDVRAGVHALLSEHQDAFDIGHQPVEHFLAQQDLTIDDDVKQEIMRIQRVYQITPDDQAMRVLLEDDIHSAYQVVQYGAARFVETFAERMGGEETARLTYAKAQQVHSAVLNIAASFVTSRSAPAMGSDATPQTIAPDANRSMAIRADATPSDVIAMPTLEGLLGSMDYCDCEHCRSILSPAAYLVDLLMFVDRPGTSEQENPQSVLFERRPDLQHLPLTCENTNTPLPYIDIVNETLEYYIAHNLSLTNFIGHDMGAGADSEVLLARPLHIDAAAYQELAGATSPPPLPFSQPLEALRLYAERFGTSLAALMEAVRKDDEVEGGETTYGWSDILVERVGLSPDEYSLLTDSSVATLSDLYGLPSNMPDQEAREALSNVKRFSRQVNVSYEEAIHLITARFINPASALIPRLERLHVSFADLAAFHDDQMTREEFEALLPQHLDPSAYGGDIPAWVENAENFARIMGIISLVDTSGGDGCDFDAVEFRYALPDDAANRLQSIDFVRLIRFIRLWKTLGWTIEQTDQAIAALYAEPGGDDEELTDLERLDRGFQTLLPRLGVLLQVMDRLDLTVERDLAALLACWADIDTSGPGSLYHRMFLRPGIADVDPAFADDGYGRFLADSDQTVLAHAETLRAAFNLTGQEFADIAGHLDVDNASVLTLSTASAFFRRGWLARALRISVLELLELSERVGLDPFAPPDPSNPPIIRLLDLVLALREAALEPVAALYLVWDRELRGRLSPDGRVIADLAGNLRRQLEAIGDEFTVVDDPTGDLARSRMALVYGATVADRFFGLLEGGAPTDDTGAHEAAAAAFFARYPGLQPHYDAYVASTNPPAVKRNTLLAALLPDLLTRRQAQQAITTITATTGTDRALAEAVLLDPTSMHAAGDTSRPALDDLIAIQQHGLSAMYWWGTQIGDPDIPNARDEAVPVLEFGQNAGQSLPHEPTGAESRTSGVWSGFLDAPETTTWTIEIEADGDAEVEEFAVDGTAPTLTAVPDGAVTRHTATVELKAGTLTGITLAVTNLSGILVVRWAPPGRAPAVIPARCLYSASLFGNLAAAFTRFLKAATLASKLGLTVGEMRHSAGSGWLDALPVPGADDSGESDGEALLAILTSMLDYRRVKVSTAPGDGHLLELLQSDATTPDWERAMEQVTGWTAGLLDAVLGHLGKTRADLPQVDVLRRVSEVYRHASSLGISPTALIDAATNRPDQGTVTALQSALRARYADSDWLAVLKPINDQLRARQRDALVAYILRRFGATKDSDNDFSHIDTPEKLFEYFLMDVQMEPCMATSRIRHAISSVQLFIERCLMNLEPRVAPALIIADQWEWMKRYRVWEANRKVFLFPENWLEPELRDDQSPIFREIMGELLQSDITEDTAATALGNYLSRLEEIALLEPCGIHYVAAASAVQSDVAHVVARSAGAGRKYFYRRRSSGSWTPWEQIKLDIEDNPVLPVVWNNRLFLYWLRIVADLPQEASAGTSSSGTGASTVTAQSPLSEITSFVKGQASAATNVTVRAILCSSELYNGSWQPVRTSDVTKPTTLDAFPVSGENAFNRAYLRLAAREEGRGLRIFISGANASYSSSFLIYSTHSMPVREEDAPRNDAAISGANLKRFLSTNFRQLVLNYMSLNPQQHLTRQVLTNAIPVHGVQPGETGGNNWLAPFFLVDGRHVFYVRTTTKPVWIETEVTYAVPDPAPEPDPWTAPLDIELPEEIRFDAVTRIQLRTAARVTYDDAEFGFAGAANLSYQ